MSRHPLSSLAQPASRAAPAASVRGVLASLSLAMLLSSMGTSSANVTLPALTQAFSASFQAVQWVVIAYLLSITVAVVSAGRLGDLVGRRRLLLAGLTVFTLSSMVSGAAPTLWLLIAARVVQGLGAAILMALAMALVSEVVPKERVGRAMGLLGTLSAMGTALGPSVGGVLLSAKGWPAVFWVNVPLGLIALALAWRHLPADAPTCAARPVRFDPAGTLLLVLALGAYALAMTLDRGRFGALNTGLLLVALLIMGVFVFVETRVAAPLVRLATVRHPVTGTGFVTSALVTTVVMATLVVGPFYLAGALGLDATHMGLVMSVGPAMAALVGAPAGRLVDGAGPRRVGVGGLLVMGLGTASLPFAAGVWGVAGYASTLALITGGYAAFQAANNTEVMASATADERGVVSGLLNLSRNLGLITGASAMGAVFNAGASVSLASGLRQTFVVATGLVALAGALFLLGAMASRRSLPAAQA